MINVTQTLRGNAFKTATKNLHLMRYLNQINANWLIAISCYGDWVGKITK